MITRFFELFNPEKEKEKTPDQFAGKQLVEGVTTDRLLAYGYYTMRAAARASLSLIGQSAIL